MERAELITFLESLGCVERHGGFVFLRDPHWSASERQEAERHFAAARAMPAEDCGWLALRTGGSGGGIKFARHDSATLAAAVEGFARHFSLRRVNAIGVLPPWHISGFMARLRCVATGGQYVDAVWKDLERGVYPALRSRDPWVISLVPTQLQRLLASRSGREWLRGFAHLFIGGGPCWPSLLEEAAAQQLPLALSYGMTETAAMVAAQRPGEFLAGDRTSGLPLPHAQIATTVEGRIVVRGASLFRGYFPTLEPRSEWLTDDLGEIDSQGRLRVLGRADGVIITGGKKVFPADVEAALLASGVVADVVVMGVPDPEWGERVVAYYPAAASAPDFSSALAALSPHQRPKAFIPVADWPRNAQGKVNRAALRKLIR